MATNGNQLVINEFKNLEHEILSLRRRRVQLRQEKERLENEKKGIEVLLGLHERSKKSR